jgi:Uma2 family endonuclease
MATAIRSVSFEEYMHTAYSPDCEYIDGEIVERNEGKGKHGFTQLAVGSILRGYASAKKLFVAVEYRVQVTATRVRIPDVCVVEELEDVVTKPPLLCVEVLSPEDRWNRTNNVIHDYHCMGAPCVWVIDPWLSWAWIFELDQPPKEVMDGKLTAQKLGVEIQLGDVLPPASE